MRAADGGRRLKERAGRPRSGSTAGGSAGRERSGSLGEKASSMAGTARPTDHTRGKVHPTRHFPIPTPLARSTPTCVGNTASMAFWRLALAVHPHMRGEYSTSRMCVVRSTGPPPHAWGIPPCRCRHGSGRGSTPTCVGNTSGPRTGRATMAVHPHMRGEYRRHRGLLDRAPGPPPHAWGIRDRQMQGWHGLRSTPTCVGNTTGPGRQPRRRTVHPHMRGEYAGGLSVSAAEEGPPPHAWGIPRRRPRQHLVQRSTPTCVGNTR